jgi:micrococcal nuclease
MKIKIRCDRLRRGYRLRIFPLLTLTLLLLLGGCQSKTKPAGQQVQVLRVVSGQALEVADIGNQSKLTMRVRLIGVDAPHPRQQPWGPAAKKRLEELIQGKPVLIESDVELKDKFDRQLAYVWQDGVLLNEKLLAEGHVLFESQSQNNKYDERLELAQDKARVLALGIWNPEKPMRQSPSEFRSQNR